MTLSTLIKAPSMDAGQFKELSKQNLALMKFCVSSTFSSFSLKLKPVDLRNLSLLASLSLDLEAGLTLTALPPYSVPFRQLAMHVCHHRALSGADLLAAVDATVVALCTADISQVGWSDHID